LSLALFDLDNTLIGGDSDHLWGEYLSEQGIVDADNYRERNDQFYQAYQQGALDILAYLEFAVEPLTQHSIGELSAIHQRFMQEKIEPIMLPKATELIDKHRQQGDILVIITATNRFITAPIAKTLGIDNLIATELEMKDQRYTGKILGEPCYQAGKKNHLQRWITDKAFDLTNSYFYSDSFNDLPLLEQVDNPVVVNPDPTLLAHAQANDWPILNLRD